MRDDVACNVVGNQGCLGIAGNLFPTSEGTDPEYDHGEERYGVDDTPQHQFPSI